MTKYQAFKAIKNDLAWERINAKLQKNISASKRALLLPAILKYAAILLIPLAIASVYYIYDTNRSYTLAGDHSGRQPLKFTGSHSGFG